MTVVTESVTAIPVTFAEDELICSSNGERELPFRAIVVISKPCRNRMWLISAAGENCFWNGRRT